MNDINDRVKVAIFFFGIGTSFAAIGIYGYLQSLHVLDLGHFYLAGFLFAALFIELGIISLWLRKQDLEDLKRAKAE